MNKEGRINYIIYYISEIHKWGYEVYDTFNDETIRRGFNYSSIEDAREAGFEKAKQVIDEIRNEMDKQQQGETNGYKDSLE